ncbi:outer membrane protein assembly factor BamA [Flavobacteriaceae bacterium]|nr:outer membrane protein assembly factor BamA [Flavobacteriaceae bacterium]
MQLSNIKKEREDLEKLVNNFRSIIYKTITVLLLASGMIYSQDVYRKGGTYVIDTITVVGLENFSDRTVVTYSGLREGQSIQMPGEEISTILKKLWNLELFSNVDLYITDIKDGAIKLEISVEELPTLLNFKVNGVKKSKAETYIEETELSEGKRLSESFLTNTKNYIRDELKKDGFLNSEVKLITVPDSIGSNKVNLNINIDKGERIKIRNINFSGNDIYSDAKLRSKLKKTKRKFPLRFWKKSKLIDTDYIEDKENIVAFYKEKGYRDALIRFDTVISNDEKTVDINLNVEEGNKYYFGDINYIGNSSYAKFQLDQILGIQKGDTYNGVLLKERIQDDNPDANDISNLYQNNGYLFSSINAVEVSAENDTIDFEIRINEGKLASFNKISVVGNTKTNDNVIYRELRIKPGELYSKDKVVRTIREVGQLGFFDAEQISPDFKNVDPNLGTVDIELGLVESGASQLELQGGYGGGGFMGTFGVAFNNFSVKNIRNRKAWRPFPSGDGQTFAVRLQTSSFYSTTSFSFVEPWFGGREPVQFSVSLSSTTQYRYDYFTRRADKSQSFQIKGFNLGIAKRLRVPDDYFVLSQSISYQYYNLKNYFTGLFTFGNGESHNIAYNIALSRNNTFTNPIFPVGGSNFSLTARFSPPYSLITGDDFSDVEQRPEYLDRNDNPIQSEIDQAKFRWLEFYKIKFDGSWYTRLFGKFVLKAQTDFGFLGTYNKNKGNIPFERFFLGGDGMMQYALDGRETIALRGYENQSLSSRDGSIIYNKFSLELRYPISLKPSASVFALSFLEAGNGFDNFKDYSPFDLKRSAGVGVRIFMPAFGLLGIDFGYGFDSANISSSGGTSGWHTHFVIGQQF